VSPREKRPRDEGAKDEAAKQAAEAADAKHAEAAETAADDVPPEQEAVEEAAPEAAAEEDAAPEDAGAEDASAEEPGEDKPAKRGRRRGSAETVAAAAPKKAAPRRADGTVLIRARARYVRSAPRKARLVMDHIRGRPVEQARAVLAHTPRAASADILKLLESALANAESNYELAADELRIQRAYVDEGPIIKRYRPRALGRATRINKRTSHMTIELTTTSEGA
jgi:large subunit ribosomal protein L22